MEPNTLKTPNINMSFEELDALLKAKNKELAEAKAAQSTARAASEAFSREGGFDDIGKLMQSALILGKHGDNIIDKLEEIKKHFLVTASCLLHNVLVPKYELFIKRLQEEAAEAKKLGNHEDCEEYNEAVNNADRKFAKVRRELDKTATPEKMKAMYEKVVKKNLSSTTPTPGPGSARSTPQPSTKTALQGQPSMPPPPTHLPRPPSSGIPRPSPPTTAPKPSSSGAPRPPPPGSARPPPKGP